MFEYVMVLFGRKSIGRILDSFSKVNQELDQFVSREEANVVKIVTQECSLAAKKQTKLAHIDRAKSVKSKIENLIN